MENCQQLLPSLQGGGGGGDDVGNRGSLREVELMSIDQCQKIPDMNDSQLVLEADVAVNGVEVAEMSGGKRRRGRPPRNQPRVVSSSASTPQRKTQDEEEDVCFICFDGGSLVLCDRRGCPKAYHPACIKRDEAFFNSAAKWNCGWHICSTCQKASYYMCYTCTFSSCKKCAKDADYVNVRGNKGFCGLCMRMVMLIESTALGTKETVQVDFDDQNSWEYLFKVYWTLLKEKLSLSLAELIKAKNPWKEIASTERSFGGLGSSYYKRKKMMKQQIESLEAENSGVMKGTLPEGTSRVSEKGDTKEHALLLGMKEKKIASTPKGVDVLSDIESRESCVTPQPTEMELSVNNIETDIIWRYQDPRGKIQGPFSMETLRRWSVSGYFPPDLRIWRANERQENSILLTDALDGRYSPVQQVYHNSHVPTEDVRFAPNDGYQKRDGDVRESWDLNVDQTESKQVEERSNSMQNDESAHSCDINESAKSKESDSRSYCTAPVDIVTSNAVQTGNHVKGDNYFPGQPRVSSSLPSSSSSGKPCETQSHLVISGHGVEKRVCSSINMNENLNKTSESQIIAGNVKQDDSEGKSGKSCGQSWRSPLNDSSNGWDSNCGLISLVRALEASENNHYNDFPDLPTSTSGLNREDSKPLGTKNEQSLSSSTLHQDSGPSWSTASSLVGNGPKLSEVAGECGRYSSVPAKPSATTPTSGSGQLTHSSPTEAAENASGWDSIILEPNEYSFGDESVSDLLAEVEAMESLNGVASPTSNLRCDGELAQGVEPDFFSPVRGLNPALDSGKSDALSSTNNLRMPSQSTVSNEPIGVSQSEVLDAQKSSCGHSPSDVSVNQYEAGSDMQLPAPPATTWGMTAIDTTWREVRETTGPNCEAIQGYPNFNLEGLGQGTRNICWGTGQVTFQDNGRVNPGMYYGTQQRYLSPKGPDIQGRDSSSSRGRSSMHRHSTYGGPPPNAVGSFRPPPKGQRVCKFYERGDCKKGASCSYWHP